MNHQQTAETEAAIAKESQLLEEIFKPVWEKVRKAGELIHQLQADNERLSHKLADLERSSSQKIQSLEGELKSIRDELLAREQEIKKVRTENTQLMGNDGQHMFSYEEREIIKERIRELIAKINSYL